MGRCHQGGQGDGGLTLKGRLQLKHLHNNQRSKETMKKHAIAAAVLIIPFFSHAQSTVSIYGIVDMGVRHTSGLTASNAASPSSSTGVSSGVDNTSRLGYRGSEDLGGGLRAIFNFETGLNADVGSQANSTKFFDRASVVGLSGSWGQVTAGRQTTLLAEAINPVDAVGMRFASFNPNIVTTALSSHGLGIEYGATGASTGSYRLDNSIKYSGKFGGFTAKAMYGFGENAGSTSAQSSTGLGAMYAQGGLTVSGAFQKFKSANGLSLEGATLGAGYKWGTMKVVANYGRSEGDTSASASASTVQRVASAGTTWSATPTVDLTLAYYRLDRDRTGAAQDGYGRVIMFAEYAMSRRSKLYAEFDRTNWRNNYQGAANKDKATGLTLGMMHSF